MPGENCCTCKCFFSWLWWALKLIPYLVIMLLAIVVAIFAFIISILFSPLRCCASTQPCMRSLWEGVTWPVGVHRFFYGVEKK
eukprot:m.26232 g.26232  ORF g.26232 m.26232 type:complete len:83 (-) comp9892_c0_seq1:24-272(-)